MPILKSLNRVAAVALLAALLCSCGGGGGGDGGGGGGGNDDGGFSGSISFTADKTTLTYDHFEGDSGLAAQNVVITVTGRYSGTLYIAAQPTGQGLNPDIAFNILSDTQASFTVRPAANLPIGTYVGTLRLLACSDEACDHQVGNSPVVVNYTTTVHTTLHLSTDTANLAAVSGTSTSQDVTVTLPWNSTSYTATGYDSNWLTVAIPNATTLRLTTRSIPAGSRQTIVVVRAGNYSQQLTVNYTASVPPGGEHDLEVTPTNIALSAVEGTTSTPMTVDVRAPTWDPQGATRLQAVTLDGSQFGWLSVTAVADDYQVVADARQLRAGTYRGEIYLSVDPPAHPLMIPLTFTVGVGLATPADVDVTVDSNTTPTTPSLRGSVPVTMVTGAPIDWTAASNRDWLVLTRAAGTSGSNIEYSVDTSKLDLVNLPYGEEWAMVVVSPSNPLMSAVQFRVNAHKRLAQVFAVAPQYQLQGRSSHHILRGRGFIANRDWSQKLLIDGIPAGSRLTRVNDTKLLVDLGPAASQEVHFEATNELIPPPSSPALNVRPMRTFGYSAIPTGYRVRRLLYDHATTIVYTLEDSTDNPRFFNYNNYSGSWQGGSNFTLPGAKDLVWGIEEGKLLAAGDGGFIPVGAGPSNPYMPPGGMSISPYGSNIAQTNDLRIWYSTGAELAYIDYPSGEVVKVPSNLYGGASFAVSGDGDKLYIYFAQGGSQWAPLIMNTTDYTLQHAPISGNDNELVDGTVSEDGSRSINQWQRVRDGQFLPIGIARHDLNNWVSNASVISRDGRRAYTFAFDFDDFYRNPTIHQPRVYVFDITTPAGGDNLFPSLGYFTLPDYPVCFTAGVLNCYSNPKMTISPDGRTLFLAGGLNLIVAPIPAENMLTPAAAPPTTAKQTARPGIATKPWRVNTRAH